MRRDTIEICISAQRSVNMMVSSGGGRVTDDLFQRVLSEGIRPHKTVRNVACDLWRSRKEVTGLHGTLRS